MRSTGIVLAGTLAAAIVAFFVCLPVPEHRGPLPRRDRAASLDSHVAAAKSGSEIDRTIPSGDDDAARTSCDAASQGAAAVRVRACDETGAPLPGAHVGVLKPAEPDVHGVVSAPIEFVDGTAAMTDAAGVCTLELPGASATIDLAATAPGFAPAFWSRARAGDELRLELRPAAELTGFVRDRNGIPVAGAAIRWHCDGPRRASGETTSAADGSYRLIDVVEFLSPLDRSEVSMPWIEVTADGFAPLCFSSWHEVTRLDARRWALDLWMLRGGRIRGRVVDAATKVPVAGAVVFVRGVEDSPPPPPLRTTSGPDGRFLLEAVPPVGIQNLVPIQGEWNAQLLGDLCVVAAGHGSGWSRILQPDDEADLVLDFELPRVCDVRGRVVDEEGAPVESVRVSLYQPRADGGRCSFDHEHRFDLGDPAAAIATDPDGRYLIRDVPVFEGAAARTSIWVEQLERAGMRLERTGVDVVPAAEAVVTAPDLVMRSAAPARRRSVHFVDEAGRDVPRAGYFTLTGSRDDPESLDIMSDGDNRADASGRVEFSASDPSWSFWGWICVVARNDGFATAAVELPEASIETTVALHPEHRLHGIVRDADGRPGIAEVCVAPPRPGPFEIPGWDPWVPTSPESGRFVVRRLPAGPWRVEAIRRHRDGSADKVVLENVSDEESELKIVLPGCGEPPRKSWWEPGGPRDPEAGRVEVVIRHADTGQPVIHAELTLLRHWKNCAESRPIAPGRFVFEQVPSGDGVLRVVVKNAVTVMRPVFVHAGATTEVEIAVEPGLAVAGHVELAELPASSSREVVAIEALGGEEKSFPLASDGAFELRGLDPTCRYRLALESEFDRNVTLRWLCAEPARSPADAGSDWRPRFEAPGRVTVNRGKRDPIREGTVVRFLAEAGFEADRWIADEDEPELTRRLPLGNYTVHLDLPDCTTQERRVTVSKAGETATVEFEER
jgi:hypothetical protein